MRVLVMAKEPVPGRVKTRLCPPLDPAGAAEVAAAALHDTLDAVLASGAEECVVALDGTPGPWLPRRAHVVAQRGGSFAERLENAWAHMRGPTLQIGMDTPQLTAAGVDEALRLAEHGPAALGPAEDGGWWALAVREPRRGMFAGVPMSDASTGERQRRRLRALGLEPEPLPTLRDVDRWDDALAVAALAPQGRFAATVARLAGAAVTRAARA
ncbi:MAG: DUF2064 domain-containing protein [Frankiales bacterium]|nr:DUF2064 domain-containing protein [Frankiales bacterium]